MNLLKYSGPMPFNFISQKLNVERSKLAYHIRVLKNADLIQNYYEKQENMKNHSFYRLTELGMWVLSNDLELSVESRLYKKITSKTKKDSEQSDKENLENEKEEVVKDPRIRYETYRITVKY